MDVLLIAERQLVVLANEASEGRDYDAATALLEAARRVKMVGDNGMAIADAEPLSSPATAIGQNTSSANGEMSLPSTTTIGRRARKKDYPKFLRDGDSLVKVGWSKAEKAEYEHKSSKKALLALGQALAAIGTKGRRFTMDKVLPLNDPSDSSALPDYQCYLCLAWLRHSGLVIQHGRQGYSLPKNGDLPTAVERNWEQLPIRS
jgi:hypothetical protein